MALLKEDCGRAAAAKPSKAKMSCITVDLYKTSPAAPVFVCVWGSRRELDGSSTGVQRRSSCWRPNCSCQSNLGQRGLDLWRVFGYCLSVNFFGPRCLVRIHKRHQTPEASRIPDPLVPPNSVGAVRLALTDCVINIKQHNAQLIMPMPIT